jgi:hypothetical protein
MPSHVVGGMMKALRGPGAISKAGSKAKAKRKTPPMAVTKAGSQGALGRLGHAGAIAADDPISMHKHYGPPK